MIDKQIEKNRYEILHSDIISKIKQIANRIVDKTKQNYYYESKCGQKKMKSTKSDNTFCFHLYCKINNCVNGKCQYGNLANQSTNNHTKYKNL